MKVEELKSTNRSFWETLQYIGLVSKQVPVTLKTRLDGGKVSIQKDGPLFTDPVVLSVTMGGLRNKEIPADVKALFKTDIFPILLQVEDFSGFDQNNSGKITLHFHKGTLDKFD